MGGRDFECMPGFAGSNWCVKLMTNMHPALRTLAMSIPAINLVLSSVAALVIIVRRSLNVGK